MKRVCLEGWFLHVCVYFYSDFITPNVDVWGSQGKICSTVNQCSELLLFIMYAIAMHSFHIQNSGSHSLPTAWILL